MRSSPPMKATKSQQSWTGGYWNTPKKITPFPKTKQPQQDGRKDTIMIESNPISTRWVTHKLENSNTKEVLPLIPQPGDLTEGLGTPRNLTLKASGI